MDKYTISSSKYSFLKINLDYPKEFRQLHNDYHLDPDKIEIKRALLSIYQTKIDDFDNIPIGNVKKQVPNFSGKEK